MKKRWMIGVALLLGLVLLISGCTETPAGPSGPAYVENGTTVKLEYNDGISSPHRVIVEKGGSMAQPAVPVRTGYTFTGWSSTKDGKTAETLPYSPTGDTTLYAVWDAYKCKVTFDMNYTGSEAVVREVAYGGSVTAPEKPERTNMSFYYWAASPDGGAPVEFPCTAKSDTTFYAIWAAGDLTVVSFDLGYEGAEPYEDITVADGESITQKQVANPSRDNYKFKGWSETENGSTIRFPYTPSASVTLHAVWERNTYTIAFRNEYTDTPKVVFASAKVDGGESINAPEKNPVRQGWIFDGWYTSNAGGTKVEFPYTPSGNAALYSHWVHEPVQTNVFQAEYVSIDPNETYPGYSGEARGTAIISQVTTETGVVTDRDRPLNSRVTEHYGYYITYLYKPDATLEFVIECSEEVKGATLKANLSVEMQAVWTFAPTGESAYRVEVNGKDLNYGTISFAGNPADSSTSYKAPFREYTLGKIDLKKGTNVIRLITANTNTAFGGTMKAVAPMVDCIKIEDIGSATLTWQPCYDNLG